jgi:hypothetical protein
MFGPHFFDTLTTPARCPHDARTGTGAPGPLA